MKHLFDIKQLTNQEILELIETAISFKNGSKTAKYNLYAANLFFENSTRTKTSFEVAEANLGIQSIAFDTSHSSVTKGESLYDTCKTLEMLGIRLLVIRHHENEYYKQLENLNLSIINGGDGTGQHPTQCLLDLMTIYEEFKRFQGLKIAIVGDIKHSRVAKSNYDALTALGASVEFIAPDQLSDFPTRNLDDVIEEVDVLMLLRIQLERHQYNYNKDHYNERYGLNLRRYQKMKKGAIIMHPAPVNRGVEIVDELVEANQSRIFTQMKNGVFMRQAIIEKVLKG